MYMKVYSLNHVCSDVALECAGFLAGLGMSTSLMVRSRPLKSFDQVSSLLSSSLLMPIP